MQNLIEDQPTGACEHNTQRVLSYKKYLILIDNKQYHNCCDITINGSTIWTIKPNVMW